MLSKFKGTSVFAHALLNSCSDFSNDHTFSEAGDKSFPFISDDGDVYIPLENNYEFDSRKTAVKKPGDPMNRISSADFTQDYIEDEILTIPYTKDMFLPTLIKDILSNVGTYGILVKKGDYIVNPGHPLIAFLISTGMLTLPEEGEIHIFNWSSRVNNNVLTAPHQKFYNDFYMGLFDDIGSLVKNMTSTKMETITPSSTINDIINNPIIGTENIPIKVRKEELSSSTGNINSLIVPLQMLVSSVATPYYGVTQINHPTEEEYMTGYNVTPMFSGNIGMDWDSTFNEVEFSSDNVCTDSYPRYSPVGWLTLSRVTTNNMYYEEIIIPGEVWYFTQASKIISTEIWADIEKEELEKLKEVA